MFRSIDSGASQRLPRMGPGLLLRVFTKRARRNPEGAAGPLRSEFTMPGLDQADIARYRDALGFAPGPVPLSWWYLPVQRAHMATMATDAFPYRIAGIVHVENTLVEHGAAPAVPNSGPVMLSTRIDILPPSASGAVYLALETVVRCGERPVVTCTSRYLAVRGQRSGQPRRDRPAAEPGAAIDSWTLAPSSGRRYARVSGDWNPIHLTRWSARLMGLPQPIIHGMHSLGKACAVLERVGERHVTSISVRFTAPVPLGETVLLARGAEPGRYALFCGGVQAAEGAFELA